MSQRFFVMGKSQKTDRDELGGLTNCRSPSQYPDLWKLPNFVSDPAHLEAGQHTSFPQLQNRQKAAFSGVKRLMREIPQFGRTH
ncbi:MAG: hypothetical protein DWI00_18000 [Planctomycetota bacterium]|nr:MAG: hypothetical protein DWI00_18000 [Planctomycetota bacterium]